MAISAEYRSKFEALQRLRLYMRKTILDQDVNPQNYRICVNIDGLRLRLIESRRRLYTYF